MNWEFCDSITLANARISKRDSARQAKTAREIIRRLNRQPGVILADEVGMGKTYIALAVAVSVIESTRGRRPVVVMVPASVQEKWPREWRFFHEVCYQGKRKIRATEHSINRGAAFLKLLDDPADRRKHLIFLTHGALTNSLADPFVKLALIRRALRRPSMADKRRVFPRWADRIIGYRVFRDEELVAMLLKKHPNSWRDQYRKVKGADLDDDPVPKALVKVLIKVDLRPLIDALRAVPQRTSPTIEARLAKVRQEIKWALKELWKECLRAIDIRLPLLILDEAHHLKNPRTVFASLFESKDAEEEANLLHGPLGGVFERMLFLTATPFQLGHHELINVLRRFEGIHWKRQYLRDEYRQELVALEERLNAAQAAAVRLDLAWGRLPPLEGDWWKSPESLSPAVRQTLERVDEARSRARAAQRRLKKWVIRHSRPDRDRRRQNWHGEAIVEHGSDGGLKVEGPSVLPFLLAARAQALLAVNRQQYSDKARAYFAEGLASSFEAYRETRRNREAGEIVDDVPAGDTGVISAETHWYLVQIDRALPQRRREAWGHHPKVRATVDRVADLWLNGEKVLVFCFYRATGRSLRSWISQAIEEAILKRAAEWPRLEGNGREEIKKELELFGERFFDPDSKETELARSQVGVVLSEVDVPSDYLELSIDIVIRFLRTPSFLVRYIPGQRLSDRSATLRHAFDAKDVSGHTLRQKVKTFGQMVGELLPSERAELFEALTSLQTGSIFGAAASSFDDESALRERLLPNVRLANGEVKRETRNRLMLAFNTPFFPEVLIASSVMAEGVDLHRHCRHVIHHDLDWNPSVLEQRTGRLDRLGSKGEITKKPIVVYEPYIEGTQDERQFRVVKDRERWFSVVMGEKLQLDEHSTSRMGERVPLPEELARRVTMKLSL